MIFLPATEDHAAWKGKPGGFHGSDALQHASLPITLMSSPSQTQPTGDKVPSGDGTLPVGNAKETMSQENRERYRCRCYGDNRREGETGQRAATGEGGEGERGRARSRDVFDCIN